MRQVRSREKWFGHDPGRWDEFVRRYRDELAANSKAVQELIDAASKGPVLVYAARAEQHNEALALQHLLQQRLAAISAGGESDGRA